MNSLIDIRLESNRYQKINFKGALRVYLWVKKKSTTSNQVTLTLKDFRLGKGMSKSEQTR